MNIPSNITRNIHDITGKSSRLTAEALEDLLCYYAPVILKDRVSEQFQSLFVKLKSIWQKCKGFNYDERNLLEIDKQIIDFVKQYEMLVF